MYQYIVLLCLLMSIHNLKAQDSIVIGHTIQFDSKILDERHSIQIQLPENYSNSNFSKGKYPVLYVLDGKWNFRFIAAFERFNTKFMHRLMPEMIIVGITSADRRRDFTPTSVKRDMSDGTIKSVGGEAVKFDRFLAEELKPYIEKHYRTSGYDMLWGHSFSGLYVLHSLISYPDRYDAYIAVDPSMWWDNGYMIDKLAAKWRSTDFNNNYLFVAQTHYNYKGKVHMTSQKTAQFGREFLNNPTFNSTLKRGFKAYPDESHNEVPIPATRDAFKDMFGKMALPVGDLKAHPEMLAKTYQKLSQKLGFEFYPDESLLISVISYLKRVGSQNSVDTLLEYALDIYPKSKALQAFI